MNKVCRHAYVSGRVQGVWFRAFVREQAKEFGIRGWANNLTDGRVEVLLCGDRDAVNSVENTLHRGPPLARVTEVIVDSQNWQEFENFSIG